MKLNVLAIALTASAISALSANAQVVIEERRDPAVVIERDRPDTSVTIEKRDGFLGTEKKTITKETTGSGDCSSKTVHKVDITGSKTVFNVHSVIV
ncbi:MAG TPA: hypothetical protein VL198_14755 [Pseudolabrys sp.]|nr:hypothetical protein [Pseudolabrys sp.]